MAVTIPKSLQPPKRPKTQYQIYQSRLPKQQTLSKPTSSNAQALENYNKQLAQIKFENEARRLATRIMQGKKVSFYTNGQFNQQLANLTNQMVKGTGFFRRGAKSTAEFIEQRDALISSVEEDAQMTLTPEIRREIILEAQKSGGVKYEISPQTGIKIVKESRPTLQQEQMSIPAINLLPPRGQPSVVGLPPSASDRFKSSARREGVVSAAVKFPFQEIGSLYQQKEFERASRDPSYQLYQVQATKRLVTDVAPVSVYFVAPQSVAAGLLAAEGAEELITPSGRKRIREQKKGFEDSGFSSTTSTIFAYGIPTAELTLGGFGVASQIRGATRAAEIKKAIPKTTFKAERIPITEEVEGLSIISRTKLGKQDFVGVAGQVSMKGAKGKPSVGISKGFVLTEAEAVPVRNIGVTEQIGKGKFVKEVKPVAVKKDIGEAFRTRSSTAADGRVSSSELIGISRKEGEITNIIAGSPKLRVGKGEAKLIFRPTITGTIKPKQMDTIFFRPKSSEFKTDIKSSGKGEAKTKQVQKAITKDETVLELVGGLEKESKVTAISQVKQTAKLKSLPAQTSRLGSLTSGLFTGQKQKEETISSFGLDSISLDAQTSRSKTKQETKFQQKELDRDAVSLISGQASQLTQREKQTVKPFLSSLSVSSTRQKQRTTPFIPNFSFPGEVPPKKVLLPPPKIPIPKRDKFGREQLFEGYVKRKGKWKKVTKPVPVKNAWGTSASIVDRKLSAQFRVKPAKKDIKGKEKFVYAETSKFPKPSPYWNNNKFKFRQFKQRKGQRTKITGGIERQTYRLDSPGETKTIQRARNVRNLFGF